MMQIGPFIVPIQPQDLVKLKIWNEKEVLLAACQVACKEIYLDCCDWQRTSGGGQTKVFMLIRKIYSSYRHLNVTAAFFSAFPTYIANIVVILYS